MSGPVSVYAVTCPRGHKYRVTVPPQYRETQHQDCPQSCVHCDAKLATFTLVFQGECEPGTRETDPKPVVHDGIE